MPEQLEELRRAVEAGDARSLEQTAHSLKRSSGNLGAVRMVALCNELQELGRSGDLTETPMHISRLAEEFGRVSSAFERELA